MSNASFKLDGNAPTVSWADPKITPDNSAATSQVVINSWSSQIKVCILLTSLRHSVFGKLLELKIVFSFNTLSSTSNLAILSLYLAACICSYVKSIDS